MPCALSFSTAASSFSTLRPLMATRAPARPNTSAMRRLMPLLPPVTKTALPLSSPSRKTLTSAVAPRPGEEQLGHALEHHLELERRVRAPGHHRGQRVRQVEVGEH